jgi:hypothetical protein
MRQIATAMIMYINANKGHFPPCALQPSTAYPNGWWWPNELVRGKFISAPSCYTTPGQTNKVFRSPNLFKCPEGVDEDDSAGGGGNYPTDSKNNAYRIVNDSNPGCQAEGFAIPSWYMLTSRNLSGSGAVAASSTDSTITKAGGKITPFLYFNSTDPAKYSDPAWQRTMSMIHKTSEVVMLVEASNENWYDQTQYSTFDMYLKRLGARHGKKTADGMNAYTNRGSIIRFAASCVWKGSECVCCCTLSRRRSEPGSSLRRDRFATTIAN